MSEEYGSGESTNGEQDNDTTSKSPTSGEKSPGQSSSSSAPGDDDGDSPCSSSSVGVAPGAGSAERVLSSTPQQFRRVSKDTDSTCARTDLVFVHPPPDEKEMAVSATKVS